MAIIHERIQVISIDFTISTHDQLLFRVRLITHSVAADTATATAAAAAACCNAQDIQCTLTADYN
jgi:hypothetical protein